MKTIGKINVLLLAILISTSPILAQEIHEAAINGDLDKVKKMLKIDPKLVDVRDNSGKTPLHWACMGVHKDVVKYLVDQGSDVNARDNNKVSPLHSLSILGHNECIKLLLKKGANIGLKDISGNDALFYAAYAGQKDIVEILCDNGAKINVKNNNDLTPTDLAIDNNRKETANLLISKGGKPTPVKDAKIFHLANNISRITFFYIQPTNIIVCAGSDGILLIDTGFRRTTKKLKSTIKKLVKRKIKYIINTHQHMDHIGGNTIAGDKVKIIDYANLKQMVSEGVLKKGKSSLKGKSNKTFATYYTMYFNNHEIRIIPSPGAHTNEDLMIHILDSGLLHMGDLLISQSFPSLTRGAKVLEYLEILDKVIDIFPADTKFIGGHGRDLTMKELRDYQKMLLSTIEIVKKGMKAGKSVEGMQKEKLLKDYESYNTFIPELNTDYWIRVIYRSYKGKI